MTPGLIAFLAGLTVLIVMYALTSVKTPPRRKSVQDSILKQVEPTGDDSSTKFSKYVRPMLSEFIPSIPGATRMTDAQYSSTMQLIVRSGNPWRLRPEEFRGTQYLFAVLGIAFGLVIAFLELAPIPWYGMLLLMGFAGYVTPYSVYNSARQKRMREIQKQLPEALDLLVVTMTSGLNFEPALAQVTPRLPDGLLKDEFTKINSEIRSGRQLESSLLAFSDRAASDEAESFARAVAQSQKLGADVSETLAGQATAARDAYEALLDKKIAKLDSMLFAFLAPTMLPAFMIIFVAPSMSQLGGGFI